MILPQSHILNCIREGDISIDPFQPENLKESSYTFTLDELCFEIEAGVEAIDLRKAPAPLVSRHIDAEGFRLEPQSFLLCQTKERLSLSATISCFLSGRGSCAQIGLNALQSSQYAEPGTSQKLMLEVSNAGPRAVQIFPGMKIVKGIFVPMANAESLAAAALWETHSKLEARPRSWWRDRRAR